jgi:small-conductance mechanosensitive channel
MEASEYNFIASQIEEKEQKEELIATLSSMHDTPNAQAYVPAARENFNKINQAVNKNFAIMESRCSQLEQKLANATEIVNDKRSYETKIRKQVEDTEKSLKEIVSKNQELQVKIVESETELSTLTQKKKKIINDKLALVGSMNDEQKYFVLKKAKNNNNTEIIDLLLGSGFDEQTYLDSIHIENETEIVGQTDELPDLLN